MRTIGVAIPVPPPWGRQLQEYRESIGDPMSTLIPPHITLMPPIDLAPGVLELVEQHLAGLAPRVPAFEVQLRGTATFRPVSPVIFLALTEGISGCERLEREVRQGPLGVDLTFPYHPHVTVAHGLPDEVLDKAFGDLAGFECRFTVDEFTLYTHDDVDGWLPMRSFALGVR